MSLINKRIDDLRDSVKRLECDLKKVEAVLKEDIRDIKQDIRGLRLIVYKIFEVGTREER